MKGSRVAKASFLALTMVMLVFYSPVASSQTVVEVGEPLHLYIRRKPVQDMTYLHFYPPDFERIGDNISYRKTLQQKGSPGDSFHMFYPQDQKSNFLQFEPNSSVQFYYNFSVSAQNPPPPVAGETNYRIKVLIELDYDHDRVYDKEFEIMLSGITGQGIEVKEGNVPVDINDLEKFQGDTGGRIRVNLSRQDDLSSVVTVYCGTDGHHSWFQLPYSKYKYGESDEDGSDNQMLIVLLVVIVFIAVVAAVLIYRDTQQRRARSREEDRSSKRRKR